MIEKFFYKTTIPLVKNQIGNLAGINSSEVYHFSTFGVVTRCQFKPNFPIIIHSVGISTGHGIVNETTDSFVTVYVNGSNPIVTQLVPFFPAEISVGKELVLPDIPPLTQYDLVIASTLGVSMVNLPDVLDGEDLDITIFFTAELDKNAFVEVAP